MIDAGLSLIVRSETGQLSSGLRDKIAALEQKFVEYHLRRGDLPFESYSSEAHEYTLYYGGVPLIARWRIKRYVPHQISEVIRTEEQMEEEVYPGF